MHLSTEKSFETSRIYANLQNHIISIGVNMGNYDPRVIGEMLNASFNNNELADLAFNLDINLPDEVAHLPKSGKVIEIVKFAVNRGADRQIVNYVQEHNSYQYEQYKPRLSMINPSSNQGGQNKGGTLPQGATTQKNINSEGGNVFTGSISSGGDVIGGNVTNNYHNTTDPELKEILSGISKIMEELVDKEPVVQHVTNQTINFGDNATISGTLNAVQAEKIEGSFNTVAQSNAAEDLKTLLNEFLEEIKTLPTKGEVKPDDLDELVKNGDILVDQASSDKPDEDFIGLSMTKLKKAAKNIGDLATPVVTAAVKIIGALGLAL